MKGLALRTIVALVISVLVLAVIASVFLLQIQMSPLEAQKIFSEGCLVYCRQISDIASSTGDRIELAAVHVTASLRNTPFIRACNTLYPDTIKYPYLCWNRDCCKFNVLPP